jgi:hypothetical protein
MSSSLAQPRSQRRENTTILRALEDNDLRKQVDAGLQRLLLFYLESVGYVQSRYIML